MDNIKDKHIEVTVLLKLVGIGRKAMINRPLKDFFSNNILVGEIS